MVPPHGNGDIVAGSTSIGSSSSSSSSRVSKKTTGYANFWHGNNACIDKELQGIDTAAIIQIGSMGWERVTENELQSHYTYKFKCKTDCCRYASKEWTVVRRFSDFDTLCSIFLRHSHLGAVLPPLPPKFFATDEKVASQREVDLLLFLREVAKYPKLVYSYEFKAFLETSSSGMDMLRQFYERDYHRLVFSSNIASSNVANDHNNYASATGVRNERNGDNAEETIVFANELAESDIRSRSQQQKDIELLSPQSDGSSSPVSTSTTASTSITSRASYWAGEASQIMGSLYLMASDGVEAISKTSPIQAATRTVVGAKGAMMNKIYGQHGNSKHDLFMFPFCLYPHQ